MLTYYTRGLLKQIADSGSFAHETKYLASAYATVDIYKSSQILHSI